MITWLITVDDRFTDKFELPIKFEISATDSAVDVDSFVVICLILLFFYFIPAFNVMLRYKSITN